jgi:hypothetical protein
MLPSGTRLSKAKLLDDGAPDGVGFELAARCHNALVLILGLTIFRAQRTKRVVMAGPSRTKDGVATARLCRP